MRRGFVTPARRALSSAAGRRTFLCILMTDPTRTRVGSRMAVVTPTYAPDFDLFSDLHESVLRWFPTEVRHVIVANDSDLALFRRFEGPRCSVIGVGDVLPGSVRALPVGKLWVNLRRPLPPLRGWKGRTPCAA